MYDILKDIIFHKAQLNNYNSSKNSFYISESDRSAKCRKIELLKFESEDKTFAFELDSKNTKCGGVQKLSPYFTNRKGFDKGNDAIIFTELKGKKYIFICELKDGGKPKEFLPQFKSSKCFVEYLKTILNTFYELDTSNIIIKYLVFSQIAKIITPTGGKYQPTKYNGFDVFHMNCCKGKYYIESFIKE